MSLWKKKHKVEKREKVFICSSGYHAMKREFMRLGWVENKDKYSVCFDFKWVCKRKDIDFRALKEGQIVNHFSASQITAKSGLCRAIRDLIWYSTEDHHSFFPKCYDLIDEDMMDEFVEEFKLVKAESILKDFVKAEGHLKKDEK